MSVNVVKGNSKECIIGTCHSTSACVQQQRGAQLNKHTQLTLSHYGMQVYNKL